MNYDVIIVGSGPAGLSTALELANRQPQLHIGIVDKEKMIGRKLRASGNGKCNVTNDRWNSNCFYSHDMDLFAAWFEKRTNEDVKAFCEKQGILLYRNNGYYYPVTNQGNQFTDTLIRRCTQANIDFISETELKDFRVQGDSLHELDLVKDDTRTKTYCKALVLTTGGSVYPKLGGKDNGKMLRKRLNVYMYPLVPVLSPIYVTEDLSLAKGVRIDGKVTLQIEQDTYEESGQIQINQDCISGIVVMNLSCIYNQGYTKDSKIRIDLLPEFDEETLQATMLNQMKKDSVYEALLAFLPTGLVKYIVKQHCLLGTQIIEECRKEDIANIIHILKNLELSPIMKEDYDKAQVTSGGVSLRELDMDTFSLKKMNNIYLAGEVLDVHGKCGGYNISFAILSGITVANGIAKLIDKESV